MENLNTNGNPEPSEPSNWPALFLRWLLGAIAGIGLSSWVYFGLKNDTFIGPFFWVVEMVYIFFVPFVGHLYLFYPGATSFSHVNDFLMTFPVLLWGLIGALLASGKKSQVTTGIALLIIFVVVGYVAAFLGALRMPT